MAREPIPGPLVLGNAGELKLRWDFGGRLRLNVLHFTGTSTRPVNQANVDITNEAVRGIFGSSGLGALTAPVYGFAGISVRDMATSTSAEFSGTNLTPVVGTGTSDALPSQIALVASLHTDKRGRNYHGRVYIPGADETDSDGAGLPTTPYITAVRLFVDEIRGHLASVNWPMAVVSRAYPADDANGLPAKPADFANVVSVTVDASFDTQRRRKI
jgi:hypothetical protein